MGAGKEKQTLVIPLNEEVSGKNLTITLAGDSQPCLKFYLQEKHEETPDLKGDVNEDGSVDVADISSIISVMAGEETDFGTKADVNGDGNVDVADISTVITIMAQ